jgi:hypothetical protein
MKITVFWDMVLLFYLEAGGSRFVLNADKYIPEKKRPNLNENSQLGQTVSGQDMNSESLKYESNVLTIRPRCSVMLRRKMERSPMACCPYRFS